MTQRPKLSNFELQFYNIPQNLAKILPNFISGQKMVQFYGKKCIFRWGLKRGPPYINVKKYGGTDRVESAIMKFFNPNKVGGWWRPPPPPVFSPPFLAE